MKNKPDWVLIGVFIWIAATAGYILHLGIQLIR